MQVARKLAQHEVPLILSHRRPHFSDKSITQEALPVLIIDESQHSDLS
jgi:hypothetical protein